MGIKYPTLGTLPPIHKEQIFVSYALEISQGRNLKNLPRLGFKSVHNYLRALVEDTNWEDSDRKEKSALMKAMG